MKSNIDFLDSPLTIWTKSLLDNEKFDYDQLSNGNILHEILKQTDSRLQNLYLPNDTLVNNDFNSILLNFDFLLRTIRSHYQFNLNQILVYKLPDIYQIVKHPKSEETCKELEIFLVLLLGCAINGDYKEVFIENIQKYLDTSIQVQLVPYIQLVTEDISFSISKIESPVSKKAPHQQQTQSPNSSISSTSSLLQSCQNILQNQQTNSLNTPQNLSKILTIIQHLVDERDSYIESIIELKQDKDFLQMQIYSRNLGDTSSHQIISNVPTHGSTQNLLNNVHTCNLIVNDGVHALNENNNVNLNVNDSNLIINKQQKVSMELVECKVKMRQLRIEIEEKSEQIECLREELIAIRAEINKLRSENIELNQKAALVSIYSEEVELLRDKSLKCDKYECEMIKFKEKLEEFDMIKVRCDELKDENLVLLETRTYLERQIDQYQLKLSSVNRHENEAIKYRHDLGELQAQFSHDQARIRELLETQTKLELEVKNLINENHGLNEELNYYKNKIPVSTCTIVQQSTNSNAKILQMELDLKKLGNELHNYKQNESRLQNELDQKTQEVESLKKDIQTLKNHDSSDNSKIKELSLQLIKLQFDEKQLRKQKSLEDEEELNKLRFEIEALKLKNAEHEEEKNSLRLKLDDNYSKQLKIIELEQDIKKLHKLNDLLKDDLNRAYTEKETLENKGRLMDKEIIKQKQQIDAKNMSLDECMKKIKTLVDECQQEQKLKKHVLALEKQVEEFRRKNIDLKQETPTTKDTLYLTHLHKNYHQLLESHDKLSLSYRQLIGDHEQLQKVYFKLECDCERLLKKFNKQNTNQKLLAEKDEEMRKIETDKYQQLNRDFMDVLNKNEHAENRIEQLQVELANVRSENTKLNDEFTIQKDAFQATINQLNEKLQAFEVTIDKLEDEKTQLFDQLHILLQQNQELLTQALNSKDVYHEHTKAYMEKLNNLHRQKEILEQKIMEQYKNATNNKKKRSGLMDLVSKKTHKLVQRVRTKSTSSSSASSTLASNSTQLNRIIDNSLSSIQSSHYDELAIPFNQSLEFCDSDQNSFDQVSAIEVKNTHQTSSPYSQILSNRRLSKSPASFLNENRLNALSKELAASAHALNEISSCNDHTQSTKKYCSNENLLEFVSSSECKSPLKMNEIEIIEKANSDTLFNPTISTQNKYYLTPRQTKTDPKLLKLSRTNTSESSSSSPTSVTSQFISSTTSTSTPLDKDAYKQATLPYRTDNYSQLQLKHLSNSTSNSLSSSSSSSSTTTINNAHNQLQNRVFPTTMNRSSCVRRLNSSVNDKQSFDTGYYEEVEIPVTPTNSSINRTLVQQQLQQQQSPSITKSNEIWLEYGCI